MYTESSLQSEEGQKEQQMSPFFLTQVFAMKTTHFNCLTHQEKPNGQGRSHDSSSGQVEFVPSSSDLHFRIGAIEIFSYGYFEYRTLV